MWCWCDRGRYGCSKWAVEVLLKQLHEKYGVPIKIFRCGMILSHTRCSLSPAHLRHELLHTTSYMQHHLQHNIVIAKQSKLPVLVVHSRPMNPAIPPVNGTSQSKADCR